MENNYFRITAYNEKENISVIIDSHGMFDKLWQFSAFLISKGFNILNANKAETFLDGNIEKTDSDSEHVIVRACGMGKPITTDYKVQNKTHNAIQINGCLYVPEV